MKQWHTRFVGLALMLFVGAIVLSAAAPASRLFRHERKEVAGLAIVFGAEPEPALTEEMQFLRWRVGSREGAEPYTELRSAEVRITKDGERFGPFAVRGVRGTAGQYRTRHIFTEPGEYESVLSFRKGDDGTVHTVDFNFNINDRADLEIPRKRGGA